MTATVKAGPVGETARASSIHTQSGGCDGLAPLGARASESWDPLRPALADCSACANHPDWVMPTSKECLFADSNKTSHADRRPRSHGPHW